MDNPETDNISRMDNPETGNISRMDNPVTGNISRMDNPETGNISRMDNPFFELTPKETVLGIFSDESSLQKIAPFLFLVAINYIHCCKWTDTKPFLNIFRVKVKQKEKIEKINALVENKMYKHDNKWCYIHELNL